MQRIEKLESWDFPDTRPLRDGYDVKTVPDMSAANISILMDKINEIIDTVNQLLPTG